MATFLGGTVYESGPGNLVYEPLWQDEDDGMQFTSNSEEFLAKDEALNAFYRDAREEQVKCSVDVYEYSWNHETVHFIPHTGDPDEGTD